MSAEQSEILDELRVAGEDFLRTYAASKRSEVSDWDNSFAKENALLKLRAIADQAEAAFAELRVENDQLAQTLEAAFELGCLERFEDSCKRQVQFFVAAATPSLEASKLLAENRSDSGRMVLRLFEVLLGESLRSLRITLIYFPSMIDILTPEVRALVMTVSVPWRAYLRSMYNLFWSAIRHPLSETTIDLSTGRVLYRT